MEVPEGLLTGPLLLWGRADRYVPGHPPRLRAVCPSVHPSEPVPSPISSLLAEPYKNRVRFSPTTIHFNTVTREDTGKYICEVVGDGSHIAKSEVNLIVQGAAAPEPPSLPIPCMALLSQDPLLVPLAELILVSTVTWGQPARGRMPARPSHAL